MNVSLTNQWNLVQLRINLQLRLGWCQMRLKPIYEDNVRYIRKFLNFCYADFHNALVEDQRRVFGELLSLSIRSACIPPIVARTPSKELWNMIKVYQQDLKEFLEWFVDKNAKGMKLHFSLPCLFVNGKMNQQDNFNLYVLTSTGSKFIDLEALKQDRYIEIVATFREPRAMQERIKVPTIGIDFLRAIDGSLDDSLLRCPKCKKIFFNPTKRKQVYCSTQCRNLAGVHRIRAKQRKPKKQKT